MVSFVIVDNMAGKEFGLQPTEKKMELTQVNKLQQFHPEEVLVELPATLRNTITNETITTNVIYDVVQRHPCNMLLPLDLIQKLNLKSPITFVRDVDGVDKEVSLYIHFEISIFKYKALMDAQYFDGVTEPTIYNSAINDLGFTKEEVIYWATHQPIN